MEEEEHTDRKQQLAMLYQKLNKIKKYLNEGNGMNNYSFQSKINIHQCHMSTLCKIITTSRTCYR